MSSDKLIEVLREVGHWDRRGDTVAERWDEVHGPGAWKALLAHEAEKQAGPVAAHGWVTMWPAIGGGHKPVYRPGEEKPCYGSELDARLTVYPVYVAPPSPLAEQDKEDAELLLLIERLEDASSKALTQAHNAGKVAHKAGIYMPSIEAGAELARAIIALRDFAARAKKEPQ